MNILKLEDYLKFPLAMFVFWMFMDIMTMQIVRLLKVCIQRKSGINWYVWKIIKRVIFVKSLILIF